jgi:Asp-tRNA(Asn)/Glu-tRNA(Gln) amidotransferase A subunit family amidase
MASLIRDGEISPVELVDAHLRQIRKLNPVLNAFVEVYPEEALEQARNLQDLQAHGEIPGLLHGVPVTVKDSFDIAGRPTLCGSCLRQGHRAAHDSTAVARLRAAGAVVIGKTSTPEFLNYYETDNHLIGPTNNPWNPELTAGGSSGGESAAIAALCSAGGIGSDGGGSIRVPAHCCGIAGLKPTPGRVPATGHFPEIAHPGGLLGVAGPMARTAKDVALLFAVLAGHDDQDPFSAPVPLRTPDPTGLRIGYMEQFLDCPVQPAVSAAVIAASKSLEAIGWSVEEFRPSGLERAVSLWFFFFGRLPAELTERSFGKRRSDAHWTSVELLERALKEPVPSSTEVLEKLAIRDKMRAGLLRQMRDYRILLTPVAGVTAWPHRQKSFPAGGREIDIVESMAPSSVFNLLGMPAITIPFSRTDEGIPVGVQLVAAPYEEELLLHVAEKLEEVRGPFPAPPLAAV